MTFSQERPFRNTLEIFVRPSNDPNQQTENLDKALTLLKKALEREGMIQTIKEKEYFISPGRKRHIKKQLQKYKKKLKKKKQENISHKDFFRMDKKTY